MMLVQMDNLKNSEILGILWIAEMQLLIPESFRELLPNDKWSIISSFDKVHRIFLKQTVEMHWIICIQNTKTSWNRTFSVDVMDSVRNCGSLLDVKLIYLAPISPVDIYQNWIPQCPKNIDSNIAKSYQKARLTLIKLNKY